MNTILPHFQSQQRQGQDDGQHHLSLEARVRELKKGLASLELGEAVGSLTLADNNEDVGVSELEEEIGNLLVHFIDATVASDATSDLQESVDRVMALIAAFGITYSTEVATKIMERAMEFSTVLLERIRGHACVLLGKIAKTLLEMKRNKKNTEEDLEWIEDCLEQVLEALVPRLQDKGQAVRCHAITAVGNVFATAEDVENYETVLEALMWSVSHDPSVSNRIAAVQSVPVNEKTLDVIISRVRDVKPKVRAEALHALRTKVEDATELSEQQIVDLIQYGFTDR